jgi:hypothetical protein
MTPQESQLVNDLFERLARLEASPRDPAAERMIAEGAQRAPNALYALVQTALVQDEALRRANTQIEDLQAQLEGAPEPTQQPASFLDSLREAFTGRPQRSPVPGVRASAAPASGYQPQAAQPQGAQPQPGYPPQMPPPGYAPGFGTGGSFLGTAASTAAGVLGGALLMDGIRSMFGHRSGGYEPGSFGNLADSRSSHQRGGEDSGAGASDTGVRGGMDQPGADDSQIAGGEDAGFMDAGDFDNPDDADMDDFGTDPGGSYDA